MNKNDLSIKKIYQGWGGNQQSDIPFIVWLLENPQSPVALPGAISLQCHDFIHIILGRGRELQDEAFVIGFTMRNDPKTNRYHVAIFKLFSRFFYPKKYKFKREHFKDFEAGFLVGKRAKLKSINKLAPDSYQDMSVREVKEQFGIDDEKNT
ncbi:hypothetical protein F7734_53355 [Scytonema sp. UIC 10036]|uniref:hypothetical protein n=1 Tax=Scytonema sp. UIC 10036 TaxID=2304196 RepID=UPI0012DA420A|nr:hypothetical protein [Scytonema sp. UIC 10036]MUH00598.1 hypothetical protein [Scytonema sp. UIC 10036]